TLLVQPGLRALALGRRNGDPRAMLGFLGAPGTSLGLLSVLAGKLLPTPPELTLLTPARDAVAAGHQRHRDSHEQDRHDDDRDDDSDRHPQPPFVWYPGGFPMRDSENQKSEG